MKKYSFKTSHPELVYAWIWLESLLTTERDYIHVDNSAVHEFCTYLALLVGSAHFLGVQNIKYVMAMKTLLGMGAS